MCVKQPILLCVVLLLPACEPSSSALVVDVRTDLSPTLEFTRLSAELWALEGDAGALAIDSHDVDPSIDYVSGARAGEFETSPGEYVVRVMALGADGRIATERRVLVDVPEASLSVTVLLTRDCQGVICPAIGGDPRATECHGGICVDPRCSDLAPAACAPETCSTAADCAAPACVETECVLGACLRVPDDAACPTGSCDLMTGCPETSSCSDGLMNGDETGVDCGGSCAACGPTCTDGVMNGDETGVDCGGSCPVCPAWATGGWSGCNRGTQTRSVTCESEGVPVPEVECADAPPAASRSCAWVEDLGIGGTMGIASLRNNTRGDCPSGCPSCTGPSWTPAECSDHCLALAMGGADRTCIVTNCNHDCREYAGHVNNHSAPAWRTFWAHAP